MEVNRWFAPLHTLRYSILALFVIVVLFSKLTLSASVSEVAPGHICAPDSNGDQDCGEVTKTSLHQLQQKSKECEEADFKCWCMKAIAYTNDVRRRNGKSKMLKPGPMTQLQNAKRYAATLASIGNLNHQDLGAATNDVGCNRRVGGENIAYNYDKGDVAFSCVQQWENSPGHLQNILRDNFDEVVVGFYKDQNGRVYCVQTFSVVGRTFSEANRNSVQCESVAEGTQDEGKQESLNAQNQENGKETVINESEPKDSENTSVTAGTVTDEGLNSKDEQVVNEGPQQPPLSEYDGNRINAAAANDKNKGPMASEEAEFESQGQQEQDELTNGQDPILDTETAYPENEDSRADEEVEEITEVFAEIAAGNIAKIPFTVSAGKDHPSTEFVEDDASMGNAQFAGEEESSKDGKVEQPETSEDDTSVAITAEDGGSHEMDYKTDEGERNEKKNEKMHDIGNRACRCLEVGKKCWHSLGEQTDKLCTPFHETRKQPTACKMKCCSYCLTKPKSRRCTNKVVKRLCRKMRKIIESEL